MAQKGPVTELIEVAVGVLAELVGADGTGRLGGTDPADAPPNGPRWRVLIARRPTAGVLGGYWEFPGGKREPGESLERCLVREYREELGLAVAVTASLPAVEHHYDHGRVRLCPFFCRRDGDADPQSLAVSEWRWVAPAELADYPFPPANEALLKHVRDALR